MKNEYNTQEAIYCEDDGEYRVYCNICDKLCIERLYKNHLKSRTHISNIRKKQQKIIEKFRRYIFISNTLILINIWITIVKFVIRLINLNQKTII